MEFLCISLLAQIFECMINENRFTTYGFDFILLKKVSINYTAYSMVWAILALFGSHCQFDVGMCGPSGR